MEEEKNKNEKIFFFLEKKKKLKNIFDFFVAIFKNLWPQRKSQIFGSYCLFVFLQAFFLFSKIIGIFFLLFAPYQKNL
jgi:hypothetical protein